MKKTNAWELVNKEATTIISAIEKGEVKTCKQYHDYLETVYNWKIVGAIHDIVSAYRALNGIEIPWDYESEESAE